MKGTGPRGHTPALEQSTTESQEPRMAWLGMGRILTFLPACPFQAAERKGGARFIWGIYPCSISEPPVPEGLHLCAARGPVFYIVATKFISFFALNVATSAFQTLHQDRDICSSPCPLPNPECSLLLYEAF